MDNHVFDSNLQFNHVALTDITNGDVNDDVTDSCYDNGVFMTSSMPRITPLREDDVTEDISSRCGWWKVKPGFCQRFKTPKWILTVMSIAYILQVSGHCQNDKIAVLILEERYTWFNVLVD